jgi:hypothetical protein
MPREIEIREPSGPVMFNTMADVARSIGVNHQTITTHQHKEGFPQKTRAGKWNARKVYQYFVDYNSKMLAKPAKKAAASKDEAHTRLLSAKAEAAEIDLSVRRGEAYESKSVKLAIIELGNVFSSELNVFDSRLSSMLGLTPDQQKRVRNEVESMAARINNKCLSEITVLDMNEEQ